MHPTHLSFAPKLIEWQRQHGRHHLPWQVADPYRVWLSEIMLQQTQVATVLDYYPRFIAAFPTVADLAAAGEDAVLGLWQGLGYYSRARNLHKAARQVMTEFGGRFPQTRTELERLCGVGRSTAAAIAAFAFQQRESILDGNVKRVLCRVWAQEGDPQSAAFTEQLWTLAESLLPENSADMPAYTQGLMDLGATVCKRSKPACGCCPLAADCRALAEDRVAELPRPKAPPKVTVLPLFWLCLSRTDGALWLEKRPAKGIWGGLWCVPCFESLHEMQQLAAACGVDERDLQEAETIRHRLTHRQLEITPFAARTDTTPERPGVWVLPQDLADYGLPKPLARYVSARVRAA
ncbi:A/G-specific adenine glycosylase [Neisseria sp. HSC-16F19]|nr:A/G-specific adenine glycosylase [Neisseria sp. HSC-16F19]MCP2039586.1 A/G-specific adenine glycosylase [Neisseria sp. HSC-16F19]